MFLGGGAAKITASLTPQSGKTYSTDWQSLTPDVLTTYAQAISNLDGITNDTTAVYINAGSDYYKISVADQITLALNGTDYVFDVIGFNHDDLTDASAYGEATKTGKAGISLQLHDCVAGQYSMNSSIGSNNPGWKNCNMRTYYMPIMKGWLPTAWQTAIKTVNKSSGLGGSSTSGTEITSDDCFLLAEVECYGTTSLSVSGEGMQYAYYKAGGSKRKNRQGSVAAWWARSPSSKDSTDYCVVYESNYATRSSSSSNLAVAFAFCI